MSSAQNSNGGRVWGGQVPKKRSAPPWMGDAEVSCLGQLWQEPEAGASSAAGCLACLPILRSRLTPIPSSSPGQLTEASFQLHTYEHWSSEPTGDPRAIGTDCTQTS